jgi:cytochrome c oxidase cbb3-type subunit 3
MKFRTYLEQIANVDIYPMVSLFMFLLFFILVALFVMKMSKGHTEKMALLPINKDSINDKGVR